VWESLEQQWPTATCLGKTLQYEIGWKLVYAKDYGVPQNHPRVILIGLREDIPFSPTDSPDKGLIAEKTSQGPDLIDLLSDLVDPSWKKKGVTDTYLLKPQTSVQEYLRKSRRGNFRALAAYVRPYRRC
jgi:DNA (cytosine-5)-methyltransferase 1